MTSDRPPLTEAEYAAWADVRMREMAGEFTELLPQEARDAGMRFEYGPIPLEALRHPLEGGHP